jgi:hypothetical protein
MRLPLDRRLFVKVLAATMTAISAGIVAFVCFRGSIALRDVIGSLLSGTILSYLVHLWLLPNDDRTEG